MKVKAYAIFENGGALKPFEYELEDPKENQVQIKVTYCGLCHTDLHYIDDDFGDNKYPMVLGHEIVGEVAALGSSVTRFQIGDRVGAGWQSGSCEHCESCRTGKENICAGMKATCIDQFGGFGEYINADEKFTFLIPDELDSARTAPLFCAGITTYNPFDYHNVKPWMKVGVIGIGGLGHLGLQWANKWGCEVTAFSSSPEKKEEALQFGAHRFITDISDDTLVGTYDFLLSTVTVPLDWSRYLELLKPEGKLCFVGLVLDPIKFETSELLMLQKSFVAGSVGSPLQIEQMLQFAKRHNIGAQVEVLPITQINDAIVKLRKNETRYRMVLQL